MTTALNGPRGRGKVYDTLIVGAGFTGIGTAIKLAQAGVDDFVILEREDRVGGTWRETRIPVRRAMFRRCCIRSRS